ncbi:hypothetical protein LTR95_015395, partial [Oleoguttula sp. CCFEE 5521]
PTLMSSPEELVELVAYKLDLRDMCSLRLANAELASKAFRGHFRAYFVTKRARISQRTFRYLAAATGPGRPGCLLEKLTLVVVMGPADREYGRAWSSADAALLSQAMTNIRMHSSSGRLRSLGISVEPTTARTSMHNGLV